jgi:hypothetical protein
VVFVGKMVENGGFTRKNGGKWWFYHGLLRNVMGFE